MSISNLFSENDFNIWAGSVNTDGSLETRYIPSATVENKLAHKNTDGTDRFAWAMSGAESTGNAGSNLSLRRYDDNGDLIASSIDINRADGDIGLNGDTTVSGDLKATEYTSHNDIGSSDFTINNADDSQRRWLMYKEGAESTGNAGSNFILRAVNDSDAAGAIAMRVTRATGSVEFPQGVTFAATGTATLSGGRVAVADTDITATSIVIATPQTKLAGNDTLCCENDAGVGFEIVSSDNSDTRVVNYVVIHY